MTPDQIAAILLAASGIKAGTAAETARLDALAEQAQLFLDRAALFERQGYPELAAILRRRARAVMTLDLDCELPPAPLPALRAPSPRPEGPSPALEAPKRRGRPPKPRPESSNGTVENPPGWDHV